MKITDREVVDILFKHYPKIYNDIYDHIEEQEQQ